MPEKKEVKKTKEQELTEHIINLKKGNLLLQEELYKTKLQLINAGKKLMELGQHDFI